MSKKLQVAVIEGWHPFEVIPYHAMFRSFSEIDYFPQTIENWAISSPDVRNSYDVHLFYNMNMDLQTQAFGDIVANVINDLGHSGQGIFLLHHSILAYPDHEVWNGMTGIEDRSFGYHPEQEYMMQIANPDHPVARGLEPWTVYDETYTMNDASPEDDIIFTADHPKSMKTIGWTRMYRKSRVFCFQPGHDHTTWDTPQFRQIILRGIQWTAGTI